MNGRNGGISSDYKFDFDGCFGEGGAGGVVGEGETVGEVALLNG